MTGLTGATTGNQRTLRAGIIGYGAGTRKDPGVPNVLRLVLGYADELAAPESVVVLEANLDNQNPEVTGGLFDVLKKAGALEVWLAPVYMKKGRAAVVLTALVEPAKAGLVEDANCARRRRSE